LMDKEEFLAQHSECFQLVVYVGCAGFYHGGVQQGPKGRAARPEGSKAGVRSWGGSN